MKSVRAKQPGIYGGRRMDIGDVFTVTDELFSDKWMEDLTPPVVEVPTEPLRENLSLGSPVEPEKPTEADSTVPADTDTDEKDVQS